MSVLASLGILVALVLVLAGSLVFLAAGIAARNGSASKDHAIALLASLSVDSLRSQSWGETDSIIAISARLPDATTTVDLQAARQLVGWSNTTPSLPAFLDLDTAGRPAAGLPFSNYAFRDVLYPNGSLESASIRRLAADTVTPVLGPWRRLARSAPLPPLWMAREGIPGLVSSLDLAVFWNSRDAAYHNMSAAVLALRLGDSAIAVRRARENIAVARQMMRSPVFTDYLTGMAYLRTGAVLLKRIGQVMNDPGLVDEAERLQSLSSRAKNEFVPWWSGGAQLLMGDPVLPALLPVLVNEGGLSRLPPAALSEVAHAAVTAFCMNTREILFGPNPQRRVLLDQVGGFMRTVPRMDDIVLAHRRELDSWIADPSRTNERYVDMFAQVGQRLGFFLRDPLAPLARIGLGGMKDRMIFCLSSRSLGNVMQ